MIHLTRANLIIIIMGIKTLFHHYFENNMRPSLAVETSLKALGSNLKIARLRRRLPQSQVAERAGISLNTLAKVEAGDPGVAIGNVAAIMQAIGLGAPMGDIASPASDTSGLRLESERLPKRARAPRRLI